MKRLTAQDLRKKHDDLTEKTRALEARIKARLKDLIQAHPDAIIGYKADGERTPLKAKGLDSEYYLNGMSVNSTLQYIDIIEKYLADQHPHQQQKLF